MPQHAAGQMTQRGSLSLVLSARRSVWQIRSAIMGKLQRWTGVRADTVRAEASEHAASAAAALKAGDVSGAAEALVARRYLARILEEIEAARD